jgi:secreted trypsin-like serine protease
MAYIGKIAWKNATQGQNVNINRVIVHPDYVEGLFRNDIALVELSVDVPEDFSNNIRFMELEDSAVPTGKQLMAVGWGLQPTGRQPDNLLKVLLQIVEGNNCLVHGEFVDRMMICVGQGDQKDTCAGDSGGPIVYKAYDTDERWIGVGIVSFGGAPCGSPGVRGTYTKISTYRSWVQQFVPISNATYRATTMAPNGSAGTRSLVSAWFWIIVAIILFAHTAAATTLISRRYCL